MEEKINRLTDADTYEIFNVNYSEALVNENRDNVIEMKKIMIEDLKRGKSIFMCGID
jgi:hypothetical protein